jgi:surfactin synthase thioesterase subunit
VRVSSSPEPAPDPLAKLSAEKLHLLALRLRAKTQQGAWFPPFNDSADVKMHLFCFPYAGGGAAVFQGWVRNLPLGIALAPARLSGRETRLDERPIDSMDLLISALGEAIAPHLDKPFALLGHSMGAAVAFELARALRQSGKPAPAGLFVSAARAPQLRRGHLPPPAPSDAELLEELRRLNGVPPELLENEEWMRLALPALRADATLYRNYVYTEAPPLDCPIRAYGGLDDERISRAQMEAWAEQTTKDFSLQMFPGGHFFLKTHQAEFLAALSSDLSQLISPG